MQHQPDQPPRIVVVGSINLDLVVRCERLPLPGETIAGKSLREIPGGKGANQAVAAARLGANVKMIGRVGDDAFGVRLRTELKVAGVDDTYVLETPNCESGIALISVDDAGENSIIVVPGANGRLSPADVAASELAFRDAQVLLVQLEVPLETIVAGVQMARKHGLLVIVDPAPAVDTLPAELLAADVICPNETEAARLTGKQVTTGAQACRAAEYLRDLGAVNAIVKRGQHGVAVARQNQVPRLFGSFSVDAVDSTAAGDAFAGGLGVALSEGQPFENAIAFASAAGAIAASRQGAQPAMPTRADVSNMLGKVRLSFGPQEVIPRAAMLFDRGIICGAEVMNMICDSLNDDDGTFSLEQLPEVTKQQLIAAFRHSGYVLKRRDDGELVNNVLGKWSESAE